MFASLAVDDRLCQTHQICHFVHLWQFVGCWKVGPEVEFSTLYSNISLFLMFYRISQVRSVLLFFLFHASVSGSF